MKILFRNNFTFIYIFYVLFIYFIFLFIYIYFDKLRTDAIVQFLPLSASAKVDTVVWAVPQSPEV